MTDWNPVTETFFTYRDLATRTAAALFQTAEGVWQLDVLQHGEFREHLLGDGTDLDHIKEVATATVANPRYQEPAPLGYAGEGTLEDVTAHVQQLDDSGGMEL